MIEPGFDVTRSSDPLPLAPNREVLGLAVPEQRVLLTEDNDRGELANRPRLPFVGVVRVDLKVLSKQAQAKRVVETLMKLGDDVRSAIVSIEAGRTRIRKMFIDK